MAASRKATTTFQNWLYAASRLHAHRASEPHEIASELIEDEAQTGSTSIIEAAEQFSI